MKSGFALLLLIFCCSLAFGQQDTTLIFKSPGYMKDPLRAQLNKKVIKKDSLWVVLLSNKKGLLVEEIPYADEKLEVRKGTYRLYENGVRTVEGNYEKGYKIDRWKSFYPHGQLKLVETFGLDKFWGIYRVFYVSGKTKITGQYINNKKVGVWQNFNEDGSLLGEEFYSENGISVEK